MRTIFLTILLLFIAFGGTVIADVPPDSVAVSISVSNLSPIIGDSLTVFVTVTIPHGTTVREPRAENDLSAYDAERQWYRQESGPDSSSIDRYGFLIYALVPDSLTIGPFAVDYQSLNDISGTTISERIVIPVQDVLPPTQQGEAPLPEPNRPPVVIERQGLPIWAVILIIIAIFAVAYGVWRYLRRRKRLIETSPVPAGPIDEIAEFERIRSLRLYEKGEIKALYISVSDAMRAFLNRSMHFEAVYETSGEIIDNLSKEKLDDTTFAAIRDIFAESDMVKFAKYSPSPELCSTLIDRAIVPVKSIIYLREQERLKREMEMKNSTVSSPASLSSSKDQGGA